MNSVLVGLHQKKNLSLTPVQIETLELMAKGFSIQEIVRHFLQKNTIISFERLKELVVFLVQEKLILNSTFQSYFANPIQLEKPSIFEELSEKVFGPSEEPFFLENEIKNIPFLRNLDPEIRKLFLYNSSLIETPADIVVCEQGKLQRSLFVLFRGQVTVNKINSQGHRRKVAVLMPGSVFGEVGFFLGEPRTAEIVTDKKCLILRIKYMPEIYDDLIRTEKARALQQRFWVVHALLKSPTFHGIPEESFDSLIFSGALKPFKAQSVICREGDSGSTCYIMVQGSAVVSQHGKSIRVLGQGDCFGEVALLMTGGRRSATVQAQTDILTLEISAKSFYELLQQNLLLACELEKVALSRIHQDQSSISN